jgi:hypothetical protein
LARTDSIVSRSEIGLTGFSPPRFFAISWAASFAYRATFLYFSDSSESMDTPLDTACFFFKMPGYSGMFLKATFLIGDFDSSFGAFWS